MIRPEISCRQDLRSIIENILKANDIDVISIALTGYTYTCIISYKPYKLDVVNSISWYLNTRRISSVFEVILKEK